MNRRQKQAMRETLITVLSGTFVNWPVSLAFLYICLDLLELSTFWTSIVVTGAVMMVSLVRVFTIRMYYIKEEERRL